MSIALLFAFIAFFGWGTADILGGLVSRKIGGFSATIWNNIFSILLTSVYVPFALSSLHNITTLSIILLIVLSLLIQVALVSFYIGLEKGNASLVGTIGSAFSSLSVIFSVVFLGDKINLVQGVIIGVIFIGLILAGLNLKNINLKNIFSDKGIPYAFVAMILWALYFTFIRIPVREVGWFWPSYFASLAFPIIFLIMKSKKVSMQRLPTNKIIIQSILNAVLTSIALFAYNFAVISGKTAIVAPIAGSYPVLFVILAYFVFKDRLTKQQVAGIIITLAGVVGLSFISS